MPACVGASTPTGTKTMAIERNTAAGTGRDGESGFTLIELAIVLVIIGLIVGGVLQGQALITNARTTNYQNSAQGYIAAVETYRQRYNAFPGDDDEAATRFGGAVVDGAGEGTLTAADTDNLWSHLRAAGLITGAADDTSLPNNPFGGTFEFWADTDLTAPERPLGLAGPLLCATNIDTDVAQIIDTALDDGAGDTGRIRGIDRANQPVIADLEDADVAEVYAPDQTFIICHRL